MAAVRRDQDRSTRQGQQIRLLILEDEPNDAELMELELRRANISFAARRVETRKDFVAGLKEPAPDLILADYRLPQFDGLSALAIVQRKCPGVPFIFVSGAIGEDRAIDLLKQGATDYVLKDRLERLGPAVRRALQEAEDRQKRQQAEEDLRASEERFALFMEHLPGVASMRDLQGRYVYVNKSWEAIFRGARSEWFRKSLEEVWPPEIAPEFRQADQEVIAGGRPSQIIHSLVHGGGLHHWLCHRFPIPGTDGKPALVGSMAIDVTEAQEAKARAQSHLRALSLLIAGVGKLAKLRDPDAMIQEICQLVLEAFDASLVWLGRAESDGEVRPLYWTGDRADYLKEIEVRWDDTPLGRGPAGRAIRTGEPVVINDLSREADFIPWRKAALARGYHTSAAFPLSSDSSIFGALMVYSNHPGFLPPERVELMQAYGRIAAAALENARLSAEASRRLQQLGALRMIDMAITASLDLRLTLNVFLDQVTRQLGVDAAAVQLFNPHSQLLEYAAGRGFRGDSIAHYQVRLGEGRVGRAAVERQLAYIPDLAAAADEFPRGFLIDENFSTCYAVPLVAKGQIKGILSIFHRSRLNSDLEWLKFLEALQVQAAIAIDNAALFDDLQRSHLELGLAYEATLEGWARALELRDDETEGHSQRVTDLTMRLGRAMGLADRDLVHLRRGALLHDIGKIGIPDSILLKPGPLNEEEWEVMRRHPVYAFELLEPISYLRPALDIPYCHHEKWNGTGYPRGLKGEAIPLAARIFAVVDVWEALNSQRPYRPAWPRDKATAYILEQAGKHLDPRVVEVFAKEILPEAAKLLKAGRLREGLKRKKACRSGS